ncbi:MAG: hypothetical protein AAB903_02170 [Patescibacteria group bacterium]
MNISVQQAQQRFRILPEGLQDAIFGVDTEELIRQGTLENKIGEDKIPKVAEITGLVLLGFLKIEDYPGELSKELGLPQNAVAGLSGFMVTRLFSPLRSQIESSYANPTTTVPGTEVKPLENKVPVIAVPETKKDGAPNQDLKSTTPPPPTSTASIPKSLAQQPESFFKSRPTEPEKTANTAPIAPFIIHQETKAESISTAPKLGFRTSENKLPGAKDRPEPLREAELTMSSNKPDVHGTPYEIGDREKKISVAAPVSPLGAKLTISKSLFSPKPATASPGSITSNFLGKIKSAFSKDSETKPYLGVLPATPIPPAASAPISPLANIQKPTTENTQPTSVKVSVQKDEAQKPAPPPTPLNKKEVPIISPLPVIKKESLKERESVLPKSIPVVLPTPPLQVPNFPATTILEKKPETSRTAVIPTISLSPVTPKVDLRKVGDISIDKIPAAPPEKKPGFFSRLFKKTGAPKKTLAPQPMKPAEPMPMRTEAKNFPSPPSSSPLPPTPPAPPQSVSLPKNITEGISQPLPAQKFSPLSGFQTKREPGISVSPVTVKIPENKTTPPTPTTNDIVTPPKVVNYSEYPVIDKPRE